MSEYRRAQLDPTRVASAALALLALLTATALSVARLPADGLGAALAFVAGLVVTPLVASPLEWLVHRYVYHRDAGPVLGRIHRVHVAHHWSYFPTWRYVTDGPPRRIPLLGADVRSPQRSFLGNAATRAAHFGFYLTSGMLLIWIPAWWLTGSVPFLVGIVLSSLVLSNLFISVHDAIHRPRSHRLLQAQPWFRFLDEHHYIHHVDPEANVNFLLPLADWLFGTLRRSLSDEELAKHGSREAAKARLQGHGEPV